MKVRDSGMPDQDLWSSFFQIDNILTCLEINNSIHRMAEVGCGFGTFTIPAASRISGNLYSFDIEPEMIQTTQEKILQENIQNIFLQQIDFIAEGSGLLSGSMDYVMLFNIMHHEKPEEILSETYRILKSGGRAGIIHWRCDIPTPRGPDLSIRPRPGQCVEWAERYGFLVLLGPVILEPYHYGLVIQK
jgi:ubiquinone/menaquinone biosynthesis C-methylase UbiE